MNKKRCPHFSILQTTIWIALFMLYTLQFVFHRFTPFMMDDLWYSTNLATEEPLRTLGDIVEGQIWHYMNWGGRSITHSLLQLTLMSGELMADLLNVGMTLLLSYMICVISGHKNLLTFFAASVLTVSLNANILYSMVWQAGAVNYVYSTLWILFFLWIYLRPLDHSTGQALPFAWLWMIPLGLITGWSNENMGPSCFVCTLMVMFYHARVQRKKIPLWMFTGSLFSLLGSILVILAPGNFVRSATITPTGPLETLYNRIFSMLQAGTDFLFPSVLLLLGLFLVYIYGMKQKPYVTDYILFIVAILSYGAMVLSPHYPDRATFGTMVLCIVLLLRILNRMLKTHPYIQRFAYMGLASLWGYAVLFFSLQIIG